VLSPDWTRAQRGVSIVIEGDQVLMEPGDLRRDIRLETAWRAPEAVLFGGPPGDAWPTPRQQGASLLRLGVGQGAWRWTHGIGNMRQGASLEDIRLGQLSRGCGTVARWTGIDHHDAQTRRRQRSHDSPLVAPGGFEPHELRGHRWESRDESSAPRVIMSDRPTFACGA
jgi:hypothetical protein